MPDACETSEIAAPVTNAPRDSSASAVSIIDVPERLATAAANRFLVAEISRLTEEIRVLKQFKEKYEDLKNKYYCAEKGLAEEIRELRQLKDKYEELKDKHYGAEKRLAVIKETLRSFRRNSVLSSVCLIAGAGGIVAAPNLQGLGPYWWYAFVSGCAVLLIAGMASTLYSVPTEDDEVSHRGKRIELW